MLYNSSISRLYRKYPSNLSWVGLIIGALFLKLDSVYGQNLSDTLEKAVTQMIADCVIQFDTGIVNTYTLLCRSL